MTEAQNEPSVTIEALMDEQRVFPPSKEFVAQANINAASVYEDGKDYETFWENQADSLLWRKKWTKTLDWSNPPFAKWFVDGKLNVTESCLDRHLENNGDKVAYYFVGEPGDERTVTYRQL